MQILAGRPAMHHSGISITVSVLAVPSLLLGRGLPASQHRLIRFQALSGLCCTKPPLPEWGPGQAGGWRTGGMLMRPSDAVHFLRVVPGRDDWPDWRNSASSGCRGKVKVSQWVACRKHRTSFPHANIHQTRTVPHKYIGRPGGLQTQLPAMLFFLNC